MEKRKLLIYSSWNLIIELNINLIKYKLEKREQCLQKPYFKMQMQRKILFIYIHHFL